VGRQKDKSQVSTDRALSFAGMQVQEKIREKALLEFLIGASFYIYIQHIHTTHMHKQMQYA